MGKEETHLGQSQEENKNKNKKLYYKERGQSENIITEEL